jgi:hypothetical protein
MTIKKSITRKNQIILHSILLMISFAVLPACEGKLDDTGIDGLDRDVTGGYLKKDTIFANAITNSKSFMDSVSTGNAQRLYLGQTGGNQFRILFYFALPTDSVVVKEGVRFQMVSAGSYGGSGTFTASIHPVLKNWSEDDVRWNRFASGTDYGPAFAQFQVSSSDTQKSVTTITIPRDTLQQWVWARTDSSRKNYGIMIDFQSDAGFIYQYYGGGVTVSSSDITPNAAYAPKLFFNWQKRNPNGVLIEDSTTIYPVTLSSGLSRFYGGRQGYLYKESSPQLSNQLWVGTGIPYHSFLRFTTDSIPKGSTISQAIMMMRVDTTGIGWVSGKTRKIQTVRVTTEPGAWNPGGIELNETDSYLVGFDATDQNRWLTSTLSGDTLKFTITEPFQSWVSYPSSNKGLRIFHGGELKGDFNDVYRLRIINDPADAERSPKIIIYYTIPPEN